MIIKKKQKYVSCKLEVLQFEVEKGFADSTFDAMQQATNQYNAWVMTSQEGHYRNEGYDVMGITWGSNRVPDINNRNNR